MPTGARLEKLTIENFAGIRRLEMDVSPFTVLIGPQSVGKSLTAKLLYFFKNLPTALYQATWRDEPVDCETAARRELLELFSETAFAGNGFVLRFSGNSKLNIQVSSGPKGFSVSLPASLRKAYEFMRGSGKLTAAKQGDKRHGSIGRVEADRRYWDAVEELIPEGPYWANFIPAVRSFYAQIERDAASFYTSANIDPFVSRFGKLMAQYKSEESQNFWSRVDPRGAVSLGLVNELLGGSYVRENNKDWILCTDGRRLPSSIWSSGQQEAYPLAMILRHHCAAQLSPCDLFIEEPEAHLFPTSQRVVTELIAMSFKAQSPIARVFLTTHSPYILTTINNLLQAGQIIAGGLSEERKKTLTGIVPEDRALAPGSVGVFYMDRDSCRSIMDEETGLIGTSEIDKASWDLSEQFEALLETQPS